MPRHPPCALNTLTLRTHQANTEKQYSHKYLQNCIKRRYSRPLYSSQTTRGHPPTTTTHAAMTTRNPNRNKQHKAAVPDTQQYDKPHPAHKHRPVTSPNQHETTTTAATTGHQDKLSTRIKKAPTTITGAACTKIKLLRKEVIQPHLPVRLPCYDFVPIADPTFDSSLTSLGHWLRVLPTFMT